MKLNEEVVALLAQKHKSVATAESCTGGLLAKLITDVSGASEVFGYGIVSYANEVKWGQLGVNRETVERFGAVSEPTAREMAQCARCNGAADFGIATTGIAGPTGGTPEKPNGTCYIGFCDGERTLVKCVQTGLSDRDKNRSIFAAKALEFLKEELDG